MAVSAGASSVLARQIGAGAEADLFLSANPTWADALKDQTLATHDLLSNQLVVASRADVAPWTPGQPLEGCVAMGDPEHVPVGVYAREALAAHWDEISEHVAPTVDAPAAVRAVQAGACPHAVAYATDVAGSGLVVGAELESNVRYPLVLLDPEARALFEWLQGPEAARIFTSHGFTRLP